MEFHVKYILNMTIDKKMPDDMAKPKKSMDLLGEVKVFSGTKEEIKAHFENQIEKFTEELNHWYYGEEE